MWLLIVIILIANNNNQKNGFIIFSYVFFKHSKSFNMLETQSYNFLNAFRFFSLTGGIMI